jgi:hypothetical protein
MAIKRSRTDFSRDYTSKNRKAKKGEYALAQKAIGGWVNRQKL